MERKRRGGGLQKPNDLIQGYYQPRTFDIVGTNRNHAPKLLQLLLPISVHGRIGIDRRTIHASLKNLTGRKGPRLQPDIGPTSAQRGQAVEDGPLEKKLDPASQQRSLVGQKAMQNGPFLLTLDRNKPVPRKDRLRIGAQRDKLASALVV